MSTIFDKTVCLCVGFHAPGTTRNGDKSILDTEADKNELKLTKRIFNSDTYAANRRIRNEAKRWLEKRSVPSPLRNGTYLIPVVLIDEVNAKLDEMIQEYNRTADQFAEEYPSLIEEWKDRLKDQFDRRNYPSARQIRRRFGVDRMILNFSLAQSDKFDQSAELEEAVQEIRTFLRQGLLDLVNRLADMLGETKDGKKKKVQGRTLQAFNEWMELLPARLVVDDDELMKLAGQARKIMEGKSVDDLRDLDRIRDETRTVLEKVGTKLKDMVKDAPSRSFGFDDE